MIVTVILEVKDQDYEKLFKGVAEPMHNSLAGNKDYVDSKIVLNVDNEKGEPSCTLYAAVDECADKEYIRKKAKEAIDLAIDKL